MNIITFLKGRKTPLTKLLPRGGTKRIADQHHLAVPTVSRMLRGKGDDYNSETVLAVLKSALEMIRLDVVNKEKELASIKAKLGKLITG